MTKRIGQAVALLTALAALVFGGAAIAGATSGEKVSGQAVGEQSGPAENSAADPDNVQSEHGANDGKDEKGGHTDATDHDNVQDENGADDAREGDTGE